MITDQVRAAAWAASAHFNVDLRWILAMIIVESEGNTYSTRYEKNWAYFKDVDIWAHKRRVTDNTERIHQMTSWGLMHVMGSVARELGFDRDLPELCDPIIGAHFGTKKIVQLQKKYSTLEDIAAAYNAGTVVKLPDGRYKNQHHVDKVIKAFSTIHDVKITKG